LETLSRVSHVQIDLGKVESCLTGIIISSLESTLKRTIINGLACDKLPFGVAHTLTIAPP